MNGEDDARLSVAVREGRFHRHGLIQWWNQDLLAEATALVLGVGALGNEIVKNLCLLGVGRIRMVDLDVVENSNLSRSPLFRERHEGLAKVHAAAEAARDLFPAVRVSAHQVDIVHDLGWGHYLDADVVIAGLDGREARLSANRACIRVGKHFFDGAIEGIDGVARTFDGRQGACYECTMGERDWELLRHRRSCNMLSRDQMESGRTPTVTTASSIVAALQVQQAVKHLHGLEVQAGTGLSVNGIGFDAWQVRYTFNEDCYAHEPAEELVRMPWCAGTTTVAEVIEEAQRRLGAQAHLELRHDIMIRRECSRCGLTEMPLAPVGRLGQGAALCSACGSSARWETTNRIERHSALATRTLGECGIPRYDVIRLRAGSATIDAVLDGDRHNDWHPLPDG